MARNAGTGTGRKRGGRVGLYFSAAAFSAAATVAAFPPLGAWPLAFVMYAPLVAALDRASPRAAFGMIFAYDLAAGTTIARFLVVPLVGDYAIAPWRAWLFTIGFVALCSLIHAGAAALFAALRPRFGAFMAPLCFAAIWVLGEELRAGPFAAPWVLAGQAVVPSPIWIQVADLGGVAAVGLPVAAVSAGVGMAAARRCWRPLVAPALLASLTLAYGALRLAEADDAAPAMRVGVVQASIPPRERFLEGSAKRNVTRHLLATRELLEAGPLDLVVWAETSVDAYLESEPETALALQRFVDRTGVPLVTGVPRFQEGRYYTNSIVLFAAGADTPEAYDKQRLVPFAEYDPIGAPWLEPLIGELFQDKPYTPGTEARVFRAGPMPLATPVCFEISYADDMRRFREGGAELLLNLSNDAWFGRTGFAELHLRHAQLRAVELRIWVVRGANTGISAVIDPLGRVQGSLGVFEEGTLRGRVGPAGARPFFARAGAGPLLALLILLVAASTVLGRRGPGDGGASC